jgi:hypothetical protein
MTKFGVKATVILGTICLVPLIGWGTAAAAQSADTDGKKCQVTGGANKGKTGVFTEGGTWCEGSWGGTECGSTKCKALAKAVIDQGGTVVFDGNKGGLVSSFGYFATPDHGLVGCTVATPTDSELPATAICQSVAMEQLGNLKASENEKDRRNAEAVSKALSHLPPR